ncbi:alpha-(1-_3)-arabinofuranosyltransferase domain-containing protein [Flexivirga oryzae]|uniref:Arabinofuranan 3-O-arabinosyltransferase n=1 Tax=Flexivirga oryzae TaxID=1794944 RepID=A0A839N836_9MICO|nr:alpha-(1->3)-arabinofuranosyltransferase family protein [Flexivirga oryzae]MBB2891375.1 arabinofuranan 3-O-arabinosyltransferase [Flexivirga oryzae]
MTEGYDAQVDAPADRRRVHRIQLLLMLAVFVVLPWLVSPGRTEPDTKIDLTISPWRYLGRSLDAWNNHAGLGELQNQAYGYLFPMGPIFGVCRSLGIPGWATQRVWWTLLLVVSFLGAQQLIRRLGVAGPLPAIAGGAAYALAPRMLTVLPVISIEAWPMALAPWLVVAVLPLTRRSLTRAELIRALALAGVLTAALGGVNATASGIVLALPFVFLLTHPVGRRRLLLWVGTAVLGGLWWLLPLLVLGRYAYPFLDYIETASITTAVTSVPNVFRGADDWIAYILDSADHPVWQGGWVLAQSVTAIIATGVVAAVGCWGLLRLRGHLARWTLCCAVAAVLFMSLGHGGSVGSPLSEPVRALLDGALAPLRNVHKADPVLRLPLVIGLAAVLHHVSSSGKARHRFAPAIIALAVAVAATPIWQGRVGAADAYAAIPTQWTQVAHEIDSAAKTSGGATLLLPNSRTPTYTWGSTTDEPLAALAASPVVTREAAPLGIPGSTRILDVVDQLAATGVSQPSLAAGLARLGIERVVLRRDLAPSVRAQPWQRVQRTLRLSPGFRQQAVYGEGGSTLTVYDITGAADKGAAVYSSEPVTVAGGPEALFAMYAAGVLSEDQWYQLDSRVSGNADVVTDSMPWRAYNDGVPTAYAYSPVLTRGDDEPTRIGAKDLPPATDPSTQPAREWIGWSDVQVSSSAADPFATHYLDVRDGPASAFDGDDGTAWLTGDHAREAWLRGTLRKPTAVSKVTLRLAGPAQHATLPERVHVTVGGHTETVAVRGRTTITVPVRGADVRSITVRLDASGDAIDPVLGIVGMTLAGTRLGSVIDVPQPVDLSSRTLLLTRLPEDGPSITRQVHLAGDGAVAGTVWLRTDGRSISSRCGAAGSITVRSADGSTQRIPLRLKGKAWTVKGALIRATTCGSSSAAAERRSVSRPRATTITVSASHGLTPELASFGKPPIAPSTDRAITSVSGDSGDRVIRVGAGGAGDVVSLSEGFNAGWRATDAAGHRLQSVEVDGWRQGFRLVGSGADTVTLRFTPTTPQRLGLLVGALLALALLLTFLAAALVCRRSGRNDLDELGRRGGSLGRRGGAPGERAGRSLSAEERSGGAVEATSGDLDKLGRRGGSLGRRGGSLGRRGGAPGRRGGAPGRRGGSLGRLAAVVVGFLVAGPLGILPGVVAAATPRRWLRHVAAIALVASCVALAFFGVVDATSAGAIAGQLLATVTLAALARAACGSAGAPDAGSAAPPASPTPTRSAS